MNAVRLSGDPKSIDDAAVKPFGNYFFVTKTGRQDSFALSMNSNTIDAACRQAEFRHHLAIANADRSRKLDVQYIRDVEACLFIDGIASPSDYMSMAFRRRVVFAGENKVGATDRFDAWLPFDLWSIVAAFVAPVKPMDGISAADKKAVHLRLADNYSKAVTDSTSDTFRQTFSLWTYEESLHHMTAAIELDKSVSRTDRANLHLRQKQYKSALVDYNYELFHREPSPSSKATELLYRRRSDALFGLNDIAGAIDSRMNAVRVSADLDAVGDDLARIDDWRNLLTKSSS